MNILKKFIDLILYSNLWIGLAGLTMALQTQLLLTKKIEFTPLIGLIFFSTLFLYALHRIVGISKVHKFIEDVERYAVIAKFRHHIIVYAVIAAVGGLYCFWYVSWSIWWALIIPVFISLGYVLPFLSGKKRLRDFNHIKIYLVAIVWAWITVTLVAIDYNQALSMSGILLFLERSFFIFAITIPFDIRDLKVDTHSAVKTIPASIGIAKSKQLILGLISMVIILGIVNFYLGTYNLPQLIALITSTLIAYALGHYSDTNSHDYWFTGLLDGTMILQFLLIWGVGFL